MFSSSRDFSNDHKVSGSNPKFFNLCVILKDCLFVVYPTSNDNQILLRMGVVHVIELDSVLNKEHRRSRSSVQSNSDIRNNGQMFYFT